MAILDTFVSVFSADTAGLAKGHEAAKKSTDDIVKSMKSADIQAEKTTNTMASMAARVGGFLAAALLSQKTIGSVIERSSQIHLMAQTADSIGVAVGELDAFRKSLKENGVESGAAESSLTNLFKAVGEAATEATGSQAKAFEGLGVSIKDSQGNIRDVVSVMQDLAGAAEGMDGAKAEAFISKLGITDRRTIETLLKGKKALVGNMQAQKDLGVVTKEQAELAGKLDTAMNKMSGGIERSRDAFTSALTPAITYVIDKFGDLIQWMNEHRSLIVGFFGAIALVVADVYTPAIISAAVAAWALVAPFLAVALPIIALAAAFALLYEDIVNFMDGNDSLIGQIVEKYPVVGKAIAQLVSMFQSAVTVITVLVGFIADAFSDFGLGIKEVFISFAKSLLGGLISAIEFSSELGDVFSGMANNVVGIFKWLWEQIKSYLAFIGTAADTVKSAFSWIKGKITGDVNVNATAAQAGAAMGNSAMQSAAREPMNSVTSNMVNKQSTETRETNVQIGEITVQTQATDARGTSKAIGSELQSQLKNLSHESATGMAR